MADLYISEYSHQARDAMGGVLPSGQEPAVTTQKVGIGGVSDQSLAFNEQTRFVRVHADVACHLKFGSNPTAAATGLRLAANQTEFIGVKPGHKLAVIQG